MTLRKLKRAVIKEELVALTGDLEQAIMLNQFIYWSERIKDFDNFINEESQRVKKEKGVESNIELQNGWIYKDMEELKEEIMLTSSVSTMSRKLKDLVDVGYLGRRNNPKYKWDKRYQYRVNLIKISRDLFELGYVLQDYKINTAELLKCPNLHNDSSRLHDDSPRLHNGSSRLHDDRALSEITTEITKETTTRAGGGDEELKEVTRLFQNNGFGLINMTTSQRLIDLIDTYTGEWVIDAMNIAIDNNKRNLSYVNAILKRWHADGKDDGLENKSGKPKLTEEEIRKRELIRQQVGERETPW